MNPNREEVLFALALEEPADRRSQFLDVMCENPVVLSQKEWSANYFGETKNSVRLSALPVQTAREYKWHRRLACATTNQETYFGANTGPRWCF